MNHHLSERIYDESSIFVELLILDEACEKEGVKAEFIIVGGASLLILLNRVNRTFRPTRDIDIYRESVSDKQKFADILSNVTNDRINTRVEQHMIPDSEEIYRLSELTPYKHDAFTHIKPYLPTSEMLVAIKALSDRQSDLDDIMKSGIIDVIDKQKTIQFIEEFKSFYTFADTPDAHWQEVAQELKRLLE